MAYTYLVSYNSGRGFKPAALTPCCAASVKRPACAAPFVLWIEMLLDAETKQYEYIP